MMNNITEAKKPLVSVIIPVFNGAVYLEETVKSVQYSTFRNFEIILIDDGSADRSKELCRKLEKRYRNTRFFSFANNRGLGCVLNFALKQARGRYICRINQDDRMYRYRIANQVKFLNGHKDVVAVGSYIKLFYKNGKSEITKFMENDAEINKLIHLVSPFADPSVMYRKTAALKVGGYMQEYWPADDTHLWIRMQTIGKLANIPKPLVEVRYHKDAASIKYFRKLAISTYKMHRYTHNNIKKANALIQAYWITQLISGLLLPPQWNWAIYRIMKKLISIYASFADFLKTNARRNRASAARTAPQPRKFSFSGTYKR